MAPRGLVWYLNVAALIVLLIGLGVPESQAVELPAQQGSPGGGSDWLAVDPPRDGGGGSGGEGGDPDEVVVYRIAPSGPPTSQTFDGQGAGSISIRGVREAVRIRALLFWTGLAR